MDHNRNSNNASFVAFTPMRTQSVLKSYLTLAQALEFSEEGNDEVIPVSVLFKSCHFICVAYLSPVVVWPPSDQHTGCDFETASPVCS